jgi:two-component system, OmpR family, response regulator
MMTVAKFHILHVDGDRALRELARRSLALDPAFTVESCERADEALARATALPPDLILCDVPGAELDEPALLARLAAGSRAAKIPVVLMTTRPGEFAHLKSLGAVGVIEKPFDPATLAAAVRRHLRFIKLADLREGFGQRLRDDGKRLVQLREGLQRDANASVVLEALQTCAHKLAGTAGVFEFAEVSHAAAALEDAVIARRRGAAGGEAVEHDLDALIRIIENECSAEW